MMLLGKVLAITGAASGIGARTAQTCASLGADVIAIDRNPPPERYSGFIQGDLSTANGVKAIVAALPQLDALCNVAGLSGAQGGALTVTVNFFGLRALSEGVAPKIREGGAVVNVASIAGYGWRANLARAKAMVALPGFPDVARAMADHGAPDGYGYPLSKELLLLWTQLAAHQPQFRSRRIRVVAVSPGPVETPILREFRQVLGDERVDSDIAPTGRAGVPGDIAPVVAFLCSDGARWINGTNIATDGGLEAAINAQTLGY
jgi:NAD(P)-dependent dehydrogenase (short-subunit alcohol dehydrogenase family)